MLIPEKSARISYWSQMLYGNKKKGEAFLSNLLFIESWAKEVIDEGTIVIVIYDPDTPNGAELVQILEDAGYGERALSVLFTLQMNLGEDTDWYAISADPELIPDIFDNAVARKIVFNSTDAMNAIMASGIARNALLANATALKEMWSYDFTATKVLADPTMFASISGSNTAMDALLTSTSSWGRIIHALIILRLLRIILIS